ncbi:hypothetical protein EMCRGX_G008407 [Ephydatia muelleri]
MGCDLCQKHFTLLRSGSDLTGQAESPAALAWLVGLAFGNPVRHEDDQLLQETSSLMTGQFRWSDVMGWVFVAVGHQPLARRVYVAGEVWQDY